MTEDEIENKATTSGEGIEEEDRERAVFFKAQKHEHDVVVPVLELDRESTNSTWIFATRNNGLSRTSLI